MSSLEKIFLELGCDEAYLIYKDNSSSIEEERELKKKLKMVKN